MGDAENSEYGYKREGVDQSTLRLFGRIERLVDDEIYL